MQKSELTISSLVKRLGGEFIGQPQLVINRFNSLCKAGEGEAAFASNSASKQELIKSNASLLVISKENYHFNEILNSRNLRKLSTITFHDPRLFYAKYCKFLTKNNCTDSDVKKKIDPSASIHDTALIGDGVKIGAACVVEEGTQIGKNSKIEAQSYIGKNCLIGEECHLLPNTTIMSNVLIGNEVIIHSGSIIGSDGFGYARTETKKWEKIPHQGKVLIGNNVEIGSNSSVDRGTFDSTIIEDGVKIDSQVHIAHNVIVGSDTVIAGCVGIAGSSKIGSRCQIGGAAGILDHITISSDTIIGPKSLVASDIKKSGKFL